MAVKYFYKYNGNICYITDEKQDKIYTEKTRVKGDHYFEMFKGCKRFILRKKSQGRPQFRTYKKNLASLITFRTDFNDWQDDIKRVQGGKIDYKEKQSHHFAVYFNFKKWSHNPLLKKYGTPDPCTPVSTHYEFVFMELCYMGGLMFFDPRYKGLSTPCYGYDYSSFYPWVLAKSDLKIPCRAGKKCFYSRDSWNILQSNKFEDLPYGIYKVHIQTNTTFVSKDDDSEYVAEINAENEKKKLDSCKIFSFCSDRMYTHYSIQFAAKYPDLFKIDVHKDEDNKVPCYIYKEEDLIPAKDIFGNWYSVMMDMKKLTGKNKLIKRLFSSLWGSLIKYKAHYTDDASELDMLPHTDFEPSEYRLLMNKSQLGVISSITYVETKQPYESNFARLKSFMPSYARNCVGTTIMEQGILDNVIRIHTDGIVLNKPHEFSTKCSLKKYVPGAEDKTTGQLIFENLNCYDYDWDYYREHPDYEIIDTDVTPEDYDSELDEE